MESKQTSFDNLLEKVNLLETPPKDICISYTLDLSPKEQVKYGKLGLFSFWYDLNQKSKIYSH